MAQKDERKVGGREEEEKENRDGPDKVLEAIMTFTRVFPTVIATWDCARDFLRLDPLCRRVRSSSLQPSGQWLLPSFLSSSRLECPSVARRAARRSRSSCPPSLSSSSECVIPPHSTSAATLAMESHRNSFPLACDFLLKSRS